jgi:LysM domain
VTSHTVEQGEHLSTIADRYGFVDYHIIWDYPANANLKKRRQNPNVLYPGDQLVIPDKQERKQSISTGKVHKFQFPTSKLRLIMIVRDVNGKPCGIVNASWKLTALSQSSKPALHSCAGLRVLISRRPFYVIDNQNLNEGLLRNEPQPKLLCQGGEY